MDPNICSSDLYPFVLIVVPNKNGIKHFCYSLETLSKNKYPNLEVVIVDNNSTDDSVEYIRNNFSRFKVMDKKVDSGFAGAVNTGLLYGLSRHADFAVVFSNDVAVDASFVEHAVQAAIENRADIVGFTEVNGPYDESIWGNPAELNYVSVNQPDCVSIYMLNMNTVKKVGLLDELYYMYGEDNDFFYRCNKKKCKLIKTNIHIWHKGEGFSETDDRKREVTRLIYRNWLRFSIKNLNAISIILVVLKMFLLAILPSFLFRKSKSVPSLNRLSRFSIFYRLQCFVYSVYWNLKHFKQTRGQAQTPEYLKS